MVVALGNMENAEIGTEISEILTLGSGTYIVFLLKEYKISGQKTHRKFEW